ncbi:MAG: queuosine precursor transporter [Phycisphaeraceae bacterium]
MSDAAAYVNPFADLPPLSPMKLHERRERVFLILSGLFLGTLTMLNILGITRFITLATLGEGDDQWVFAVAVGVLPYPITFLCTDFISEFYGRRRANFVVFVGLLLNAWVVFILWLGSVMDAPVMDPATGLPPIAIVDGKAEVPFGYTFFSVRNLAMGAVMASMIAYMAAQFCDVYLFHFWKKLTRGKHLWLRNNGSTMISQMVDTTAVILITHYYAHALPVNADKPIGGQLMLFIATGYAFKFACALLDTIPFYMGVGWLSRYLRIDPYKEHHADNEEVLLAMPMGNERIVDRK